MGELWVDVAGLLEWPATLSGDWNATGSASALDCPPIYPGTGEHTPYEVDCLPTNTVKARYLVEWVIRWVPPHDEPTTEEAAAVLAAVAAASAAAMRSGSIAWSAGGTSCSLVGYTEASFVDVWDYDTPPVYDAMEGLWMWSLVSIFEMYGTLSCDL